MAAPGAQGRRVEARVQGSDAHGVSRGARRRERDASTPAEHLRDREAREFPVQGAERQGPGHQRPPEVPDPRQGAPQS